METVTRRDKDEDDDVERDPGEEPMLKKVVDVGWDSVAEKDGLGGSKHENAAMH